MRVVAYVKTFWPKIHTILVNLGSHYTSFLYLRTDQETCLSIHRLVVTPDFLSGVTFPDFQTSPVLIEKMDKSRTLRKERTFH